MIGSAKNSRVFGYAKRNLVILLGAISFVFLLGSSFTGLSRVQPQLLHIAMQQPDAVVDVIVQKANAEARVEERVPALGGQIVKSLGIINAVVVRLPASAVPELANSADVRWVSLDAPIVNAGCLLCLNTANLVNHDVSDIRADAVWNSAPYLQGQGITVAVVDSGIRSHSDLTGRVLAETHAGLTTLWSTDGFGHGTHVAGIIAGNGSASNGAYVGIAPKVNLVSVKVTDELGAGLTSDIITGLQWVYDNRTRYNIRVVNLSLNSSGMNRYDVDPVDAAVEVLWFNRIVVVVAAGNNGDGLLNKGLLYPPANDPFAISVGAVDDKGTADIRDDVLAKYSAYGKTESGFAKPDLVAPGSNIVSLSAGDLSVFALTHLDHRVNSNYFRMSGTSMAAPVTAGAVALLLQSEPSLSPDQVKYRLMATARPFNNGVGVGAGYLDVYAAIHNATIRAANTGIPVSKMLLTGSNPINWNSVNWNSVNWNSVNWNSVNWNSVNWNSDYWGQ